MSKKVEKQGMEKITDQVFKRREDRKIKQKMITLFSFENPKSIIDLLVKYGEKERKTR